MKYKNRITGYEIETDCECFGGNWEAIKSPNKSVEEPKAPKKKGKKKSDK